MTNSLKKTTIEELPRIKDRLTFIYLEHCKVNRDDGALTVKDKNGIVYIPSNAISVLLLGPGTTITHDAVELVGNSGVTLIWVGEHGVRFYAYGRPLTSNSTYLQKQAEYVSNTRKHLHVARKMYQMRFPGEDVSQLTMQQLRSHEGTRIRKVYKEMASKWGVEWNKRRYRPEDFEAGDDVNKALSVANYCLYGLAHSVICALGCSPGLGFVHVGHAFSFVYDIADLYKADLSIPIAFEIASKKTDELEVEVRKKIRDEIKNRKLLSQMVTDIKFLFDMPITNDNSDSIYLWDNLNGLQEHGILYSEGLQ